MPMEVEHWSLPTLRKKLVKIGAKVIRNLNSSFYLGVNRSELAAGKLVGTSAGMFQTPSTDTSSYRMAAIFSRRCTVTPRASSPRRP